MQSRSEIILASTSLIRRELLEKSGAKVLAMPPMVDETIVKKTLSGVEPEDVAMILAQTKAMSVLESSHNTLVIGADQVLVFEGRILDKPATKEEAREQLLDLRGKTHTLISAVACARNGEVIWSHDAEANMTMRSFSFDFLGAYLAAMDEEITKSVGGYQFEGLGAQLFDKVEGDYFTILGLPLLPLLEFLREQNVFLK